MHHIYSSGSLHPWVAVYPSHPEAIEQLNLWLYYKKTIAIHLSQHIPCIVHGEENRTTNCILMLSKIMSPVAYILYLEVHCKTVYLVNASCIPFSS